MKKQNLLFLALVFSLNATAQTTEVKSTIAVANPNVTSLAIKPESAAKMMRLELIKLDKYKVYDEFDMADVLKTNPEFTQGCYGQNCLICM
jgi:hypothetical protein